MVATIAVEKKYYSYNQVHDLLRKVVQEDKAFKNFQPTLIVAIGTGGFVPARILRTFLKHEFGRTLPIQAIGLCLYDDDAATDVTKDSVRKTQWLGDLSLQGHNILIVDEVDDSRKTLQFAVSELQKDIKTQEEAYVASPMSQHTPWRSPELGIFVVHNKLKPKLGQLPKEIMDNTYFCGGEIDDNWVAYPWEALDSYEHTRLAEKGPLTNSSRCNV